MALKVLPKASTQLKGFLREYCISLRLSSHPCIVGLFGIAFQSNEHYGFAQELVVGRDLFAIIKPRVSHVALTTELFFITACAFLKVLLYSAELLYYGFVEFSIKTKKNPLPCRRGPI